LFEEHQAPHQQLLAAFFYFFSPGRQRALFAKIATFDTRREKRLCAAAESECSQSAGEMRLIRLKESRDTIAVLLTKILAHNYFKI
jgi:hypothetical protein